MYVDIHCFPLMERLVMLENSPWHYAFEALEVKAGMPTVYSWVHRIRGHASLSKFVIKKSENDRLLRYWLDNADKGKAALSIDFLD